MWQRILVFSWNQFFKISLIAISALTIHIQVLKRVDSSLCLLIFSNNEKMNSSKTDVCLIHLMLIGTWCARNYLLNIFWAPKRYTKPWWSDKKVSSCLADTFQLTHLLKPLAVRSKFFRKTRCNSKHVWQKSIQNMRRKNSTGHSLNIGRKIHLRHWTHGQVWVQYLRRTAQSKAQLSLATCSSTKPSASAEALATDWLPMCFTVAPNNSILTPHKIDQEWNVMHKLIKRLSNRIKKSYNGSVNSGS